MEDSLFVYFGVGLLVLFIWAFILIEIVKAATRQIKNNSTFQVKLLIELLKAQVFIRIL